MLLIAEIAQAHEGSLGLAHSYIDALAETGVNAVKFQVHIAEAESSAFEPFRVKFSMQDSSRYEYWKRMEFSKNQWLELKNHCEAVGLQFLASPFSNAAVDLLEEIGVTQYKIGSGEVSNFLLLQKIASTGKPVILSSGMSSLQELDESVIFLRKRDVNFSILQCTSAYPTYPEQFGLNMIQILRDRYNVKTGFSDHSSKIETCIAATALGSEILEFHAVFSRKMFGPDSTSSLEIEEIKQLVLAVNNIKRALANPLDKTQISEMRELKNIFEKSLAVNKNLRKGHVLTFEDLETKKPRGMGIDAKQFEEVIGKKINTDLNKWDFLKEQYILS